MRVVLEIRAAEGGDDAKLLVREQLAVYLKALARPSVTVQMVEDRPGFAAIEVESPDVERLLANEPGGHRWQRVPPNERHGRRHTSTVTVAVLPVRHDDELALKESDLDWTATRGSGPGGQHRNKTASAVVMTHVPTGLTVRIENERSQTQNRALARRVLAARVAGRRQDAAAAVVSADRRRQVGSGQRGDKVRTVRLQDGRVVDHRTGKRTSWERYRNGFLEDLA